MIEVEPECIINGTGEKRWELNGKLHREDGPAIEYANGDKFWYLNDELHREDGPAIEWANGDKEWFSNDKLHRADGPAIEYANGEKRWYLSDTRYPFMEWLELIPLPEQDKLKLRLQYAE